MLDAIRVCGRHPPGRDDAKNENGQQRRGDGLNFARLTMPAASPRSTEALCVRILQRGDTVSVRKSDLAADFAGSIDPIRTAVRTALSSKARGPVKRAPTRSKQRGATAGL